MIESNIMLFGYAILWVAVSAYGIGFLRPKGAVFGGALGGSIIAAGLLMLHTAQPPAGGSQPPQELLDALDRAEAAQRR